MSVYPPAFPPLNANSVRNFDRRSIKRHGKLEISLKYRIFRGLFRLHNFKAQIIPDQSMYIKSGAECPGESLMAITFLIRFHLDAEAIVAKIVEAFSFFDVDEVQVRKKLTKVGKFCLKVTSQ